MPDSRYRLYFDNEPASREMLDRVEEVSVEQALGKAWQARFLLPVCVDDQGRWPEEDADFLPSFAPTRPDDLPALVLLGSGRNLKRLQVEGDDQRPARVESISLNPSDKSVTRATSQQGDLDLLGSESPLRGEAEMARRLLEPGEDDR